MPTCVMIMLSDDGKMSVGECEPKEEMNEAYPMQEVGSIDEAFQIAESTLLGEEGAPAEIEQQGFDEATTGMEA